MKFLVVGRGSWVVGCVAGGSRLVVTPHLSLSSFLLASLSQLSNNESYE